jgi:porphobilinogen deaminase
VPSGPIDLSAATAAVDELDGLCQKAKEAAASGTSNQPIARYASYCENRISQMRTRITMVAQHGDAKQAQVVTDNAQRVLEVGRQLAAQANAPRATPTKNQ